MRAPETEPFTARTERSVLQRSGSSTGDPLTVSFRRSLTIQHAGRHQCSGAVCGVEVFSSVPFNTTISCAVGQAAAAQLQRWLHFSGVVIAIGVWRGHCYMVRAGGLQSGDLRSIPGSPSVLLCDLGQISNPT